MTPRWGRRDGLFGVSAVEPLAHAVVITTIAARNPISALWVTGFVTGPTRTYKDQPGNARSALCISDRVAIDMPHAVN